MAADSLFLIDTAQLAFRDEPAFSTDRAENPAFRNFFAEALQELVLGFVRS